MTNQASTRVLQTNPTLMSWPLTIKIGNEQIFVENERAKKAVQREILSTVSGSNLMHATESSNPLPFVSPQCRKYVPMAPKQISRYFCQKCNKLFNNWPEIRDHKQVVHKDGGTIILREIKRAAVQCKKCSLVFKNGVELSVHKMTGCGHLCDICNKRFKKPSWLKVHKISHMTPTTYNCEFCNYKTFNTPYTLKLHVQKNHKDIFQLDNV